MSVSASRNADPHVHQDFIARIRYSNALPPPHIPPKFLDIPNTGLANGQYTSPAFASRLAREQPINIEPDAELGMPLDLVGLPGVFDGDESSIQAPADPLPINPRDKALLQPLSTLGKPKTADGAVSFLRRTEYISTATRRKPDPFMKPIKNVTEPILRRQPKRKSPEPDQGTPAAIKRKIEKSFEAATSNLKDRRRIRHPSKRDVQLVDVYPMLPDLGAFPDSGAYVTVKFHNSPIPNMSVYDERLLSGLLKPTMRTAVEEAAHEAAMQAYERDPKHHPKPSSMTNYEFYLPNSQKAAKHFRARFDVDNPDCDNDALYTHNGHDCFHFERQRAYETIEEREYDHATKYDGELLMAVGRRANAPPAMLYYPVMQRSVLRNQRTKVLARTVGLKPPVDEQIISWLNVRVEDPPANLQAQMTHFSHNPLGYASPEDYASPSAGSQLPNSQHVDGQGSRDASSPLAARRDDRHSPEAGSDIDADADVDADFEE